MVDMLLFEIKLSFTFSCRSTWPRCNTVYCRWVREMALSWKTREISGNLPSSSGNFWKQQNLREFSGNGYGRFKCCFWECYIVLHLFCSQFPGKTTGKISQSPIHQGFIYVTYIYPWWIGERPVYTQTSNGSWCMGIKGEMFGTVCVTFTWYMYMYELFIAFVCFVVCSLL